MYIVRGDNRASRIVHRDWAHKVAWLVQRFTGCEHYWMTAKGAKQPLRLHFFGIGANTRLAAHAFVFIHNSIATWSMTEVDTAGHTNAEARRAKKCARVRFGLSSLTSYWRNGCASRISKMVDEELEDEKRRAARNERDIRLGKKQATLTDKKFDSQPKVALTQDEVDVLAAQPLHNEAKLAPAVTWSNTKWLICVREHETAVAKVPALSLVATDCSGLLRVQECQAHRRAPRRQAAGLVDAAHARCAQGRRRLRHSEFQPLVARPQGAAAARIG